MGEEVCDGELAGLVLKYLNKNGFYRTANMFKDEAKHLATLTHSRLAPTDSLRHIVSHYIHCDTQPNTNAHNDSIAVHTLSQLTSILNQYWTHTQQPTNSRKRHNPHSTQHYSPSSTKKAKLSNSSSSESSTSFGKTSFSASQVQPTIDLQDNERRLEEMIATQEVPNNRSVVPADLNFPDVDNDAENPLSCLWQNEDFCERLASVINSHIDPGTFDGERSVAEILPFEPILNDISQDGQVVDALQNALMGMLESDSVPTSDNKPDLPNALPPEGDSKMGEPSVEPAPAPSIPSSSSSFKQRASKPTSKQESSSQMKPTVVEKAKELVNDTSFDLDKFLDNLHNK
jgi:hypothetical protein